MNNNDYEEININYEKAKIILCNIFLLLDLLILLVFNNLIEPKNDDIISLKNKIILLIIIDSVSNIFYTITYNYLNIMFNEILYTIFSTFKFHIILSFIYHIFLNSILVKEPNNIHLINKLYLCLFYILIIFPYDKILYRFPSIIIIFESFAILVCLFMFYRYINKIMHSLTKFIKFYNLLNENVYLYLQILNYASLILFISYYFWKIILILFNNFFL